MTSAATTSATSAALDQMVSALRRGDLARAEAAFAGGGIDAESLNRLADLNIRRQRWADAAWLLDHAGPASSPATSFKRNLCRNLVSLSTTRPEVASQLASLQPDGSVTIVASGTGHPTLALQRPDGQSALLSTADRPLAAAESSLQQLRPALAKGVGIGLAGIGDGYLLYRLAREQTKLFMTTAVPVFVIEPDLQTLLHVLMIHDFSGSDGPIEQHRFTWYTGPQWPARFHQAMTDDIYRGTPTVTIGFTAAAASVRATLQSISEQVAAADQAVRARVEAYYRDYRPEDLQRLLAPDAPRKPRVLLPTTRFSTVLQYSNQDTAAAFEQLGWEARVLIEPSPAHRLFQRGIIQELESFKPDLVLQIDHLRHEHQGTFPPNLPFVCWAQDHLPNLIGDAGKQVGPTDFVLTDGVPTYVRDFYYPASQCIGLPKLTSARSGHSGGHTLAQVEDVVFVSNASRTPDVLLNERLAETTGADCRELTAAVAQRILDSFESGTPITTYVLVRELVEKTLTELGLVASRDAVRGVAAWLYHPFCDAVYRQQAMTWAADACRDLSLTFGLYGKGWDEHPQLAAHARGPITNGPALHELTRRAMINLQVVPYLCLHQRLLDGLCAGGFFLIREHLSDVAPQAMMDLLAQNDADDAMTVAEARAALAAATPDVRSRFESLLQDCRDCLCNSGVEDAVEYVRSLQEIGFLVRGEGVLPAFGQVSFRDAGSLREQIRRFAGRPDERARFTALQRQSVIQRFTYRAGIERVIRTVAQRLASNSTPSFEGREPEVQAA